MSSKSLEHIINRLNNLNTRLTDLINSGGTADELNNIKNEQENIYNLLAEINNDLFANFLAAQTLNDYQTNFGNKLEQHKLYIQDKIDEKDDETNEKVRLSKINKYYADKYEAHSKLIKLIILILIPIIILAILKNKGFLPEDTFNALMLVIIVIGGINFFKKYKDIISRDNMNYQEYNWNFRQDLAPSQKAI